MAKQKSTTRSPTAKQKSPTRSSPAEQKTPKMSHQAEWQLMMLKNQELTESCERSRARVAEKPTSPPELV